MLFKLTYTTTVDQTVKVVPAKAGDSLNLGDLKLQMNEVTADQSTVNFEFIEAGIQSGDFDFGLRFWPSYIAYMNNQASGAYDFRPIDHLFYSFPYS